MISWGAAKTTDIIAGKYDSYIRATATAIKNLGSPVFLRWFWEMDGTHFAPEAVSPAAFKAAWAYIRAIFDSVGTTNVVWVWCPTAYGDRRSDGHSRSTRARASSTGSPADGFNSYPDVVRHLPAELRQHIHDLLRLGHIGRQADDGRHHGCPGDDQPDGEGKLDLATSPGPSTSSTQGIRAMCYLDHPAGWYADLVAHVALGNRNLYERPAGLERDRSTTDLRKCGVASAGEHACRTQITSVRGIRPSSGRDSVH